MSAFDPLYQVRIIKEASDEIARAYLAGDDYSMYWRLDQIEECVNRIRSKIQASCSGLNRP